MLNWILDCINHPILEYSTNYIWSNKSDISYLKASRTLEQSRLLKGSPGSHSQSVNSTIKVSSSQVFTIVNGENGNQDSIVGRFIHLPKCLMSWSSNESGWKLSKLDEVYKQLWPSGHMQSVHPAGPEIALHFPRLFVCVPPILMCAIITSHTLLPCDFTLVDFGYSDGCFV